jgi:hypothetical protein
MYLAAKRLRDVTVRFDVVGVQACPGERPRVEIFPNAFEAQKL